MLRSGISGLRLAIRRPSPRTGAPVLGVLAKRLDGRYPAGERSAQRLAGIDPESTALVIVAVAASVALAAPMLTMGSPLAKQSGATCSTQHDRYLTARSRPPSRAGLRCAFRRCRPSSGRTVRMTGEPSYIELGVRDAEAAKSFFGQLFGWEPAGPGQVDTATLSVGIHGGDDESHFEVFFAVDNLEASIGKLGELGGRLVGDINESPGFGRWVECADDQGVRFGLRQSP
jgi:hypothetical protein